MKLLAKLTIISLIITLLVGGLIGLSFYNSWQKVLVDRIGQIQVDDAKRLMEVVDRFLYERRMDAQSISESTILGQALIGEVTIAEGVKRLERFTKSTGPWRELAVLDKNGIVKMEVHQKMEHLDWLSGANEGVKIKFDEALAGKTSYTDVYRDKEGYLTMLFFAPVRNYNETGNPVLGVVLAQLDWPVVEEIVNAGKEKFWHLYNSRGEALNGDGKIDESVLWQYLRSDKEIRSGVKVLPRKNDEGEELVIFAKQIGYLDYKGNDWVTLLRVPMIEVMAEVSKQSASQTLMIVGPTGLLLFLMMMLFLNTVVIRPIEELIEVTKQISEGELGVRVKAKSKDEVGQLGLAFNLMIDKLSATHETLEHRVEEKTRALAEKFNEEEAKNLVLESTKLAMLNLMEDIKEEKDNIEKEKAYDEAVLSSIGEGVIATDSLGRVVMMNRAAEGMLEYSFEEIRQKVFIDVVKMEDEKQQVITKENRMIYDVLIHGQKRESNVVKPNYYVRKDGSRFPVAVVVTPIKIDNITMGSVTVFKDVTKEREVDRMKTEFISLASHQLRTPLSAMKWFAEMLINGDVGQLNKEQKDFVENIYQSNERMIDLVTALLDMSRIESGRIIVEPKPTDICDLIDGVLKELDLKIREKEQKIIFDCYKKMGLVNVDPKLIRNVYMNLLTNAIKYSPNGAEITILISKSDKELVSQVADTGYGIPARQQERVFEKMFRAENAVKLETEGNGLGLYLAKSIVESSGGKMWFKSEEGKGSTFWFTLPASGMKARKGEVVLDSYATKDLGVKK